MNQSLRDRINRHLEPLSDERGYQVLDYIEFLESKYAGSAASSPSLFQRFTEGVEDTLRAGKVSASAITETVGLLNKAASVLGGVAAAGKSVATEFATAGKNVATDVANVAMKAAEAASAAANAPVNPQAATPTQPPAATPPPAQPAPPASPADRAEPDTPNPGTA
jgi:hypothetical protein